MSEGAMRQLNGITHKLLIDRLPLKIRPEFCVRLVSKQRSAI